MSFKREAPRSKRKRVEPITLPDFVIERAENFVITLENQTIEIECFKRAYHIGRAAEEFKAHRRSSTLLEQLRSRAALCREVFREAPTAAHAESFRELLRERCKDAASRDGWQ